MRARRPRRLAVGVPAACVTLGLAALLVWLLGVAGWVSLSAAGAWVAFGLGVGLLALGRAVAAAAA